MQKFLLTLHLFLMSALITINAQHINQNSITSLKEKLLAETDLTPAVVERGLKQVAALWQTKDGTQEDYLVFCEKYLCKSLKDKKVLFDRIATNFESIFGNNNKITLDLLRPTHVAGYEVLAIDELFATYNVNAHFFDDMFANKIAFIVALNFPYFNLDVKNDNGKNWDDTKWGFVRLGDIFSSRLTAELLQNISVAVGNADNYISNFNIPMGLITDENQRYYWAKDLKLISHWGLRDEIKASYADNNYGYKKQQLIYGIMKSIVEQTVPIEILTEDEGYSWRPIPNKTFINNNIEIFNTDAPNMRYQHLLNVFNAMKATDSQYAGNSTYIKRKFDSELEMTVEEVEKLFISVVSSPQVKEVADLIEKRLDRKLHPWDIWYDGFKTRSSMNQNLLDSLTKSKYPTVADFQNELPNILIDLGFDQKVAEEVCQFIKVDPSVGAGHAWGAEMKFDDARLRTRFSANGLDYKGYNIGIHELGHNVEQVISLHNVPNYFLKGVPNTAFTEALAFTFQQKDLTLLGIENNDEISEYLNTLDIFWGCYEIMGVSLVDIKVWQWMYKNPNADADELKDAVIRIAKEVWNKYYTPIFEIPDQHILAIYSHMIDAPLYLSAYPIGHIIDFQIGNHLKDKDLGDEVTRMFALGRLTPNLWMERALNATITSDALLQETQKAVGIVNDYKPSAKKTDVVKSKKSSLPKSKKLKKTKK